MKNCYIIDFNSIGDEQRGYLIALEENNNIPFNIKRVYYTYGVPTDAQRGFHAHKETEQILICLSGSIKVKCFDGDNEEVYNLDNPSQGIYLGTMLWHEMFDYQEDTVIMVLASELYEESDYIRNYEDFLEMNSKVEITTEDIVKLVNYDREYLDLSWNWLNDREIKYLTMTPSITKKEQMECFLSLPYKEDYIIYGVEYNGKKVGAVGLKNIKDNSAEYWGYIGEKEYWGKKIGSKMMDAIVNIAKNNGITQVYLRVKKENTRAINLYLNKGFENKEVKDEEIIMNKLV